MTPFEQYFIEVMEWFKSQNIDVLINGSTLLNFVRYQSVNPRPNVKIDKEINLAILAEDFTPRVYKLIEESNLYFKPIKNTQSDCSGVYFAPQRLNFPTDEQWSLDGCVFLTRLWQGKTTRYKHHEGDNCILVPNKFVNDKTKWSDISILGHGYKTVNGVGEFLDFYYGRWWVEDLDWHWYGSKNHVNYQDLIKEGEIC